MSLDTLSNATGDPKPDAQNDMENMVMYIADLHIHSRFSMATSRQLTIPHLAGWAMCKGINVLGTGDFTHPAWQAELEENLIFDEESGLYRMKVAPDMSAGQGKIQAEPPLFCLQTEISSIYKRGGKSRRVHNLVFFKRLEDVKNFSKKLAQIGNIESDGRPILGLDSRDLLELVLETSDTGVCIPAHIWTPWFSLFGSKSGFDAIEECFGDLTDHIFALETGLSSDPAMNRLVSALDKYALVSNSDAHSGANLGREANLFAGSPSYDGLFSSLRRAAKRESVAGREEYFCGTLEIYPEEGKYHLDGHRNCHVVMTPEESAAHGNICPVCGKPLTIGVLHRVWELADRKKQPVLANEPEVFPIIPLAAVFAQLGGVSSQSKAARTLYSRCLEGLGSELAVLAQLPVEQIKEYDSFLAEAVRRIRTGELGLKGGYDGEFGTIDLFSEEEMKEIAPAYAALCGRKRRSSAQVLPVQKEKAASAAPMDAKKGTKGEDRGRKHAPTGSFLEERERLRKERDADSSCITLSEEQEKACAHTGDPLLVLAGPGSGKTRVLTERMVRLLEKGTDPSSVIALTFSRKAAQEMEERVQSRLPAVSLPFCGTFHAFAWKMIKKAHPDAVLLSDQQSSALLEKAMSETMPMTGKTERRRLADCFWLRREQCLQDLGTPAEMAAAERYAALKEEGGQHVFDFTDLLEQFTASLEAKTISLSYEHVLVDEVQDLSLLQLRMLKALLPQDGTGFFGIGDPEQAVYAFRGAARDIAAQLAEIWPGLRVQGLTMSYRSSQKVLDAAGYAAGHAAGTDRPHMKAARTLSAELTGYEAPDQGLEERWVANQIAHLLPKTSHTLLDEQEGSHGHALEGALLPSDIAVLVRLKAQIPSLARALSRRGIPVQMPSMALFWQDETMERILGWLGMQLGKGHLSFGLAPYAGVQKNTVSPAELVPLIVKEKLADMPFFQSDAWAMLVKAYAQAGSWEQLFQDILWQKEVDCLQSKAQSVRILTMHAAKGLEFRAVFLPGFNDGIMPLDRMLLKGGGPGISPDEEAEERRLLYVAMTRASEAVFVSWSAKRHLYGRELELKPSRFWDSMAGCFSGRRLVSCVQKSFVQGLLCEPPAKK